MMPSSSIEQETPKAPPFTRNQRRRQGQVYSPDWLCDFMLALTLRADDRTILDPGCGPGAFLLRAADYFSSSTSSREAIHLEGIEIDPDKAELAAKSLETQLGKIDGLLQSKIVTGDFLDILSGLSTSKGGWDVIIGNPPYVRHEHLHQQDAQAKASALKQLAADYAGYLAEHPGQRALFSGTADLYLLFFLRAARLLKPGGRLAFVTSNSWLNTAIGKHFRHWLHHHFRVQALIESACERWFSDAAVNATILLLERLPSGEAASDEHRFPMLRFHQPLAKWLGTSEAPDYWPQTQRKIDALLSGTLEDSPATLRSIAQGAFLDDEASGNPALRLRAPAFIVEWLAQPRCRISLDTLGTVRYPIKTGINGFFYLSRQEAERRGIEPEYLRPVVKSIRQIRTLHLREEDCDTLLFCCPHDKAELSRRGLHGALAYVEWGERQLAPPRQKREHPVPWPQVASVRSNKPWHAIRPLPPAHLLCSRFIDRRFLFPVCDGNIIEDQTFYGLTLANAGMDSPRHPPLLIAALLNSTLSYTLLEFSARNNLGEGVLQFSRGDMADFFLPHPDLYDEKTREKIIAAFSSIKDFPVKQLPEEFTRPERVALDALVLAPLLKALGYPSGAAHTRACRAHLVEALLNRMDERRRMAQQKKIRRL